MPGLTWFKDRIQQVLPEIALSEEQFSALYNHFELLCRWNERMDLTSVDAPEEIISRHYCESLFFGAHIPEDRTEVSVLDFGSGAGFPGFPLAVLRPRWKITLLEAHRRRSVFLKEASRGVTNIRVVNRRGEEFHENHDWVIARAVKLDDVRKCIPRLGQNIGFLVGEASLNLVDGSRVRIPGSNARFCVFGQCST